MTPFSISQRDREFGRPQDAGAEALEEPHAVAVGERHVEQGDVVALLGELLFGERIGGNEV